MKKHIYIYMLLAVQVIGANIINLDIDEAITRAYRNSRTLEKYEIDLNTSDLQVKQAFKSGLPSLTLNSLWSEAEDSPVGSTGFRHQLVLTQPIFQGFRVITGARSSKDIRSLSELQLELSKKELRLEVIEGYLNLLRLREQISLLEDSIYELSQNLNMMENMLELNMITETDLLDFQLEKLKVEGSLVQLRNAEKIQSKSFKNKLNIAKDTKISLENFNISNFDINEINYTKDLDHALENNINLKILEINSELTKSKEVIDRANLLPNVAFQGTYGNQGFVDNIGDSFDPDNFSWTVGINFSWNVFSFGRNLDSLNIAKNSTKKAEIDEELARENIELLLKSTYLNLIHLDKQINLSKLALESSQRNYDLQKIKYKNQMITSLELLRAENNLRNSKFNLLDTYMSFYLNHYKYLNIIN